MRRWIISYDVADNKRRRLLVSVLAKRLHRVQESIFEGLLNMAEIRETLTEARQVLDSNDDKLRAYPISDRSNQRLFILGAQPKPQAPLEFWLF
jgi:CRISPR-associated protein Cas2